MANKTAEKVNVVQVRDLGGRIIRIITAIGYNCGELVCRDSIKSVRDIINDLVFRTEQEELEPVQTQAKLYDLYNDILREMMDAVQEQIDENAGNLNGSAMDFDIELDKMRSRLGEFFQPRNFTDELVGMYQAIEKKIESVKAQRIVEKKRVNEISEIIGDINAFIGNGVRKDYKPTLSEMATLIELIVLEKHPQMDHSDKLKFVQDFIGFLNKNKKAFCA